MTEEGKKVTALQLVCIIGGFAIAMAISMFGFGFTGIIPGAIAGALGAGLGSLVYELIRKSGKG